MTPPTTRKRPAKRGAGRAAGAKKPPLDDATRMAKALSHPLRHRILARLNDRVSSPVQLAKELGEPLGNVSYHVRALLDLDCIELVDTAPRRGALEHYYRAIRRPVLEDAAWERLPTSARRGVAGEWLRKTFDDVAAAIEAGGFDASDECHLSRTPLLFDREAWQELSEELRALYERALELQAKSAGRLQAGAEDAISARLALMLYEGAASKADKPSR